MKKGRRVKEREREREREKERESNFKASHWNTNPLSNQLPLRRRWPAGIVCFRFYTRTSAKLRTEHRTREHRKNKSNPLSVRGARTTHVGQAHTHTHTSATGGSSLLRIALSLQLRDRKEPSKQLIQPFIFLFYPCIHILARADNWIEPPSKSTQLDTRLKS